MARYILFPTTGAESTSLATARQAAVAHGATVIRAIAGGMLLEVPKSKVIELAQALHGWSYSPERKTIRVPERSPLERARAARSKA